MASNGRTTVEFYFDPACPWAWRTSLWIREVAKHRPIDIKWKFLSLEEVNRAAGTMKDTHPKSRPAFRAMALARRVGGEDAIDRLYLAIGAARHERKQDLGDLDVIRAAIREAGLSESLLDEAMNDPSTQQDVLSDHRAVVERGGFGVATLVINGSAPIFGPVIQPVPSGDEALRLWDAVEELSTHDYFFELKRSRG